MPLAKIVAFAAIIDQDQAAQNMQPDLWSVLSAMLKHYKQEIVLHDQDIIPHHEAVIKTEESVVMLKTNKSPF